MEHRPRERHQNADGLSKKTEFFKKKQIKDENLPDHMPNFKFLADPTLFDRLPELTKEEAVINSVEMDQVCKHSRQPAHCEWEQERPEGGDQNDREWIMATSPQVPPLVQNEIFAIFKEHAAHRYRQEDLQRAQEQDAANKNLTRLTKGWNGGLPDIDGRLATQVRSYYARYKSNLYVNNRNILTRTRVLTEAPAMVNDVIILPQLFQLEALHLAHDQQAHIGETKTANLILEKFDWPALHKDVARYVNSCLVCQSSKPSKKRMNRKCDAEETCEILLENWIHPYGAPLAIQSDNGSQFTA